jgi:hypothetical protein
MPIIRTFQDVHLAFARKDAPLKKDIAIAMGMRPETFSVHIRPRDSRATAEWVTRFNQAWTDVTRGNETSTYAPEHHPA